MRVSLRSSRCLAVLGVGLLLAGAPSSVAAAGPFGEALLLPAAGERVDATPGGHRAEVGKPPADPRAKLAATARASNARKAAMESRGSGPVPRVESGTADVSTGVTVLREAPIGRAPRVFLGARAHSATFALMGGNAASGLGFSARSVVGAPTLAATAPGAVTNLEGVADGDSAILVTWDPPADTGSSAITGYEVGVSPNEVSWTYDTIPADSTAFREAGLDANTTRHYRITAQNASGNGSTSSVSVTTAGAPPGPPTDLTATASATEDSVIELAWQAPADTGSSALTWYRIEGSQDGGSIWTYFSIVHAGSTTHRHAGLEPGTTWTYRVSA
ncbi:MAG: fibronectin type III domain-containing protein, partial [Gemmatimonadota bacterium]|nr:fibronectin type III domain-containing protein [Gemmatimonadota bacterium]